MALGQRLQPIKIFAFRLVRLLQIAAATRRSNVCYPIRTASRDRNAVLDMDVTGDKRISTQVTSAAKERHLLVPLIDREPSRRSLHTGFTKSGRQLVPFLVSSVVCALLFFVACVVCVVVATGPLFPFFFSSAVFGPVYLSDLLGMATGVVPTPGVVRCTMPFVVASVLALDLFLVLIAVRLTPRVDLFVVFSKVGCTARPAGGLQAVLCSTLFAEAHNFHKMLAAVAPFHTPILPQITVNRRLMRWR